MRIIYGNLAFEIKSVRIDGKRLIFTDLDDIRWHTDDYALESYAYHEFNKLTDNGYLYVKNINMAY